MKTNDQSLLEHAHLIIMALTLVIFCAGSAARYKQISQDQSYAWFGYAPASIQPVMPIQQQMSDQNKDAYAQAEATPIL